LTPLEAAMTFVAELKKGDGCAVASSTH
jgi:hypothetical protein